MSTIHTITVMEDKCPVGAKVKVVSLGESDAHLGAPQYDDILNSTGIYLGDAIVEFYNYLGRTIFTYGLQLEEVGNDAG